MKKILISVLALMPMGANAITLQGCTSVTCPTSSTAIVLDMTHPSCTSYTTKCLYNSSNNQYLRYRSCNSCSDPFEIETQKLSDELAYSSVCGTANFTTMTRNICTCGTQCDGCGALSLSLWGGTPSHMKPGRCIVVVMLPIVSVKAAQRRVVVRVIMAVLLFLLLVLESLIIASVARHPVVFMERSPPAMVPR